MIIRKEGTVKFEDNNLILNNAARSFGGGILHEYSLNMEDSHYLQTNFDKISLNATRRFPVLNWRVRTHNLDSNINLITPLLKKNETINEFIIKNK